MSQVARYAKLVAHEGRGPELGKLLLKAADELAEDPRCLLYLVSRQEDEPDVVWVTEMWRSAADLAAVSEEIRGSAEVAAAMALVKAAEMIELDLLGGKGPVASA